MPYLDIFTLPTQGEACGVASGTEQYYSFDYGNIHIVSLNSQVAIRDETNRETMKSWHPEIAFIASLRSLILMAPRKT